MTETNAQMAARIEQAIERHASSKPDAEEKLIIAALRAGAQALRAGQWQPIETAPKGSGWDGPQDTRHPDYVQPPRILGIVHGEPEVIYWDWYYAEGGSGYQPGQSAWVGTDGNVVPTLWMPLPALPPAPSQET